MDVGSREVISIFLVVAGVVIVVLGFFKNFGRQIQKIKIAKLGIDTEISTMGLWLVLGFLMSAGGVYVFLQAESMANQPVVMKLNIHFDPPEVNVKSPRFEVGAYMKTMAGEKRLPVLKRVMEGSLWIELKLPTRTTPFFLVFTTPRGVWKTDDHSVHEAAARAYKIVDE